MELHPRNRDKPLHNKPHNSNNRKRRRNRCPDRPTHSRGVRPEAGLPTPPADADSYQPLWTVAATIR